MNVEIWEFIHSIFVGMRLNPSLLLVIGFLCFFHGTHAQKSRVTEFWTDLNVFYNLSPTMRLGGDGGPRAISNSSLRSYYIRPTLVWSPSPLYRISGAIGVFHSSNGQGDRVNEYRVQQDFALNWPQFAGWHFSHRSRWEQRWFNEQGSTDFMLRTRYRLGFEPPDLNLWKRAFYTDLFWEGFIPLLSDREIDLLVNQRVTVTLGARINSFFRIEVEYLWQLARSIQYDSFELNENVWRFRIHYLINP